MNLIREQIRPIQITRGSKLSLNFIQGVKRTKRICEGSKIYFFKKKNKTKQAHSIKMVVDAMTDTRLSLREHTLVFRNTSYNILAFVFIF